MRSRVLSFSRPRSQNGRLKNLIISLALTCSLFQTPAFAKGRWYLNFGGGMGSVVSPTGLFPKASAGTSTVGTLDLMHESQQHGSFFSWQYGLVERYVGLGNYSMISSNLMNRFSFGRLFLGIGISPFLLSSGAELGSSYKHTSGYSYMGEGGYDWKIIPTFSITFSGAFEMVTANGKPGPAPSMEGLLCFKFYFADKYDPAGRKGYEGSGWRYPKGIEIR